MKSIAFYSRRLLLVAGLALSFSLLNVTPVFAQARRQPPVSDQKKNKRPTQQTGAQQEPLPPDIVGKPQEAEKLTVTTNLVNVDAVVYHKKTGQIVPNLKKQNFEI